MTTPEPGWSFSGPDGPDAWGSLDPAWERCAHGRTQSPVDLGRAVTGRRGDMAVSYHLNQLMFIDLRWTLQILANPGGILSYRSKVYDLAELHFHAPAEHTIAGDQAALEAHFVHQAADRSLAVVGVLFDVRPGTHDVDELVSTIPATAGGSMRGTRSKDLQRLVPTRSRRYRYTGSRTTPPCSENVSWIVMEDRGYVGSAALAAYTDRYEPNARPVQPLNDREITLG